MYNTMCIARDIALLVESTLGLPVFLLEINDDQEIGD
jgi:hypothetical protein